MVGLLIISHSQVGDAIYSTTKSFFGECPLQTKVLTVSQDCDPDERKQEARQYLEQLDQGDGVLILTDIFGSTPSNIAASLKADNVKIIAGINLPMLVRIMNYPKLPLKQLADKAISGGRDGVVNIN